MKKTLGHQALLTYLLLISLVVSVASCSSQNDNDALANSSTQRDCELCPLMIPVNSGEFQMGTAVAERIIDPRTGSPATNDEPQHAVRIEAFSIGIYEVSVSEFAVFINENQHSITNKCMDFSKPGGFTISAERSWQNTGFIQSGNEPVGCISFYDAQAYAVWLSSITGKNYRLPTEAEWEYAARAGATGPYFWGNTENNACDHANVRSTGADTISKRQIEADKAGFPCDDGFAHTSPVGSFTANTFGVYDMQGNNWEWVADCSHKNYEGAPNDGSAWAEENCQFGVIRGGSFLNLVQRSSVSVRAGRPRSGAASNMGFRVVKGTAATERVTAVAWKDETNDASDEGGQLFNENCAACHQERDEFQGLYGKDPESLFTAIKFGGNNVMSMPAFGQRLSDADIRLLANYVLSQNGW